MPYLAPLLELASYGLAIGFALVVYPPLLIAEASFACWWMARQLDRPRS